MNEMKKLHFDSLMFTPGLSRVLELCQYVSYDIDDQQKCPESQTFYKSSV